MTSKNVTCFHCGTEYPIRPPKPYTPCEEHEKLLNDPGYAKQLISEIQVCPECGSGARLATPETEDMLRKRPMPADWTLEERAASVHWWKILDAGRKQLQRYFSQKAARSPRADAFKDLILRALEALGQDASARDVLKRVQEIDGGKAIQEVTDDLTILWRNPSTGTEKTTTFATFQNRLSKLRQPKVST